jgi:aminopeptidase N
MRRVTALFASAAIVLGLTSATAIAQPQKDTVDTSLPTQLPREAVPHHYSLTVTPNADNLSFDGSVTIEVEVLKPTRTLTLNAADLSFKKAEISPAGKGSIAASAKADAETQTVTFDFGRMLQPGAYRLAIDYSGKINTQANGLFALDYKNKEGRDARALFTQFEASDARRFLPSWDEPDYKATFDLTARVPSAWTAVSNMPAQQSRDIGNGLKEVRFPATPTMSSYLLFFAAGDLERISKKVGQHEVGIVTTRGNAEKARYALDAEAQILPYYDDYFGTPYPLPKLDNVAGPGQSQFFGAMENWGAIFTFEKILLLDPAITSESDRQAIFTVEAHEMAHQWFGDLVTMAWWDDLWLNEGFASWMASRATQHFHPDWGADIGQVAAREEAMELDSFKSTHPIVQTIRTVEQANQAFDSITYEKGESVISMLEGFAGQNVWRAGIRDYMKNHAYQNTRTQDLWAAVEGAGARGLRQIATDFTTQPGIPLVRVGASQCVNGTTMVEIEQSQFSNDQRQQALTSPLSWHIPIRASAQNDGVRRPIKTATSMITSGPKSRIEVGGCGPLLINVGQTGYFRTLYQPAQAKALQANFAYLNPVDQYGLLADNLALSQAAYQPMAVGLDFLAAVQPNANPKVVQEAVRSWGKLCDSLEDNAAAQTEIAARVSGLYGPTLQQLGYVSRQGEKPTDTLLRPTLIATLGKLRDPAVLAEANRLFAAWQGDSNAIPGSLKETWLGVIARNADAAKWAAIHARARAATGAVERTALYQLLGRTTDEALARRALDLALTDEPGKTVSAGIMTSVAQEHPRMALEFVLAHLNQVNGLIDISGRSRFMQRLTQNSGDAELIPILEGYASKNLAATDRKPIDQAIDRIRFDAERSTRIAPQIAEWLRSHPA